MSSLRPVFKRKQVLPITVSYSLILDWFLISIKFIINIIAHCFSFDRIHMWHKYMLLFFCRELWSRTPNFTSMGVLLPGIPLWLQTGNVESSGICEPGTRSHTTVNRALCSQSKDLQGKKKSLLCIEKYSHSFVDWLKNPWPFLCSSVFLNN